MARATFRGDYSLFYLEDEINFHKKKKLKFLMKSENVLLVCFELRNNYFFAQKM